MSVYSHEFKFYVDSGDCWSEYTYDYSDGMTALFNAEADLAALTVARLVAERDEALKRADLWHRMSQANSEALWKERDELAKVRGNLESLQSAYAFVCGRLYGQKPAKKRLEDGPEYRWAVRYISGGRGYHLHSHNGKAFGWSNKEGRMLFATKREAKDALKLRDERFRGAKRETAVFVRIRVKS